MIEVSKYTAIFRAQSLFLALGTLVRPGVNVQVHCRNFRRRVKNFRCTASNTWSTYPKRIVTLQRERFRLHVAIWAYSSGIEHNENKYNNQNISHKSLSAYEVKNNLCLFEMPFKIQKNGVFLFEISFFVLEISTFFYYANQICDDVILFATKKWKILNKRYLWKY